MVAGLGNPGREYENTPHNAGFAVVEKLAEDLGGRLRRSFRYRARKAEISWEEYDFLLVEPLSYMNLSGPVVAAMAGRAGIGPDHVIVISDDADLEIGRIRTRPAGGCGGHKGLQSVRDSLGTEEFPRLRVGIGRGSREKDLVDFVLTPFSAQERIAMEEVIRQAALAVLVMVRDGVQEAMNRFNGLKIAAGSQNGVGG